MARSSNAAAAQRLSTAAGLSSTSSFHSLLQALQVGVMLNGPGGEILFANRAALDMFGIADEKQVLGMHPKDVELRAVMEDGSDCPLSMRPVAKAVQTKQPVIGQVIGWQRGGSGDTLWTLVTAMPQLGSDGSLREVITTLTDITGRKNAEAALRQASELNLRIFSSAQEGIIVHDRSLRYTRWNSYMEEMTGLRESDVVGKHPLDLFPFLAATGLYAGLQRALAGETFATGSAPFVVPQTNHSGWCENCVAPLRDAKGDIVGAVATVRDITERKRTEDRLRASETLLAQAEQLANMGSWELRVDTLELNWSAHYHRMLGFEPEPGPVTYGRGIKRIHPEDRDRAVRDMERLLRTREPLENELRFIRADRNERVFHSRAVALTDEAGSVIRIQGMSQDVTERKQEEERLRRSEALMANAEQIADFGSWEFDLRTGRTTLSKHLLQIYGLQSEAEWNRDAFWGRVHPQDRARARRLVEQGVSECKPFEFILRYKGPDRKFRVISTRGMQFPGADGRTERSVGVARDITDQVRTEEDLRNLSSRLLRLQDEERRRIARELHDSASQKLLTIGLNLAQLAVFEGPRDKKRKRVLADARRAVKDLSKEIRSLSYLLHPPLLDELGLASAIGEYVRGFSQRTGIHLEFKTQPDVGRMSKESETALFRIVQEALGNIQKHSGSSSGVIRLTKDGNETVLEIADSGRGMTTKKSRPARPESLGVGILGMRERMRQLGGRLEIASGKSGTTVKAVLPFRREDHHAGSHSAS